ncbi:MAG: GtrA family protein [Clostridia bacterium]|nr:GtrA family protein [Clostridia bacterium]
MSNKKEILRAVKFTLFSISAGIIQILTFTLLNEFADFSYWPCYLIALVLSVVWNFTLNRKYTFHSANNLPIAMLKTLAFYAVFTPLSTLLEYYLADKMGYNEYLITALNMILNFVLEYLYQRYYVFKDSIETDKKL